MTKRNDKKDRNSASVKIAWRYIIVSTFIVFFSFCILYCMFKTTVIDGDKWIAKANQVLQRRDTILPLRGDIISADGSVLATNLHFYTVRIDFRAAKFREDWFYESLDSLCDTLAARHPVRDRAEWHRYLSKALEKEPAKRSRSFTLLRNLSHSESQAVRDYPFFRRSRNTAYTGLTSESNMRRNYPYGDMARRSIGRVGQTKECKEIHGISGLEYALDSMLYGRPGLAKKEPIPTSIVNIQDVPPVNGMTLTTTIDVAMQDIVEYELGEVLKEIEAEWGTVILMETATGDIKAISNLERDRNGDYNESMNHAIQGFEPGSVMKTISMVIALEDGFVRDPDNEIYRIESGFVFGGGRPIKDTHSPSQLPVSRFLEYSSNIGMTKLVAPHFKDDPNRFRERLRELGFFDRLNTGIAGEHPPYFPPLDKKAGGLVSLGRQTYGYASQIPPLYMCAFYNAVANGGKFVRPRLVSKITTEKGDSVIPVSYIREHMCSPKTAATVRRMLHEVIYGAGGTARMLRDDLVDIAGKTGTSKIAHELSREDREKLKKNPNDPTVVRPKGYEESSYRLSFCGFFPYADPKYTCMVMVSRPAPQFRSAGNTSGKILLNIARRMYSRGMLGNESDYRGERPESKHSLPTLYASRSADRNNTVIEMLGQNKARRLAAPANVTDGVPDVTHLGLREAIVTLEEKGFRVAFDGDGVVAAQSPAPATKAPRGTTVRLNMQKR